jgi:hypothetical protein
MAASKKSSRPATDSLDELVELFETHDMGEYWDQMPVADFEIGIVKHKHLVGSGRRSHRQSRQDCAFSACFFGIPDQLPAPGEADRSGLTRRVACASGASLTIPIRRNPLHHPPTGR